MDDEFGGFDDTSTDNIDFSSDSGDSFDDSGSDFDDSGGDFRDNSLESGDEELDYEDGNMEVDDVPEGDYDIEETGNDDMSDGDTGDDSLEFGDEGFDYEDDNMEVDDVPEGDYDIEETGNDDMSDGDTGDNSLEFGDEGLDYEDESMSDLEENPEGWDTSIDEFEKENPDNADISLDENKDDLGREEFLSGLRQQVKDPNDIDYNETEKETPKMDHGQRERGGLYGDDPRYDFDSDDIGEKTINDSDNQDDTIEMNNEKNGNYDVVEQNGTEFNEVPETPEVDISKLKDDNMDLYMQSTDATYSLDGLSDRADELDVTKKMYGDEFQRKANEIDNYINQKQSKLQEMQKLGDMNDEQKQLYEQYQNDIDSLQQERNFCQERADDLLKDVKTDSTFVGVNNKPYSELSSQFIKEQGKDVEHFSGTCTECSMANGIRSINGEMTEGEVIDYARKNNLCADAGNIDYEHKTPNNLREIEGNNGATAINQRKQILNGLGYNCETRYDESLENIQSQLGEGKGAIINLDSRVLNKNNGTTEYIDEPNHSGPVKVTKDERGEYLDKYSGTDHAVTIMGLQNGSDGKPIGMWVHDTGNASSMGKGCYISKEEYKKIASSPDCAVQYISKRKK